jgi:hypothetical protein
MLTEAYPERALDAAPETLLSMIDLALCDPEAARLPACPRALGGDQLVSCARGRGVP